ncbi:down syndrome cell adhesion molecule-like protein [Dinothrombium tinctorium]|uniref:Down syndrome cell adhesion molecule-like protein n=1 Tax=Dinothrombium tinctorium TaxID=1965070 RepID=A0A443RKU6_9ACAR|nr:down syndrome cell adhesion molecule-like protein [Dinothrombium tinctorium]
MIASPPTVTIATPLSPSSSASTRRNIRPGASEKRQQQRQLKQENSNMRAFNYLEGPRFTYEPPGGIVHYSNDTGISIHCSATGLPKPQIFWIVSASVALTDRVATKIARLREPLMNGSIIFAAFAASAYRQDIHSATYRCVAENTVGLIISRAVHLRAGECQSSAFLASCPRLVLVSVHLFSLFDQLR